MVKIRVFGIFRLDTGIKEMTADVKTVRAAIRAVAAEARRLNPDTVVDEKALRGCIISINGAQARPNDKLNDGDELALVPAVAGG